jgi:four helix bundle protein
MKSSFDHEKLLAYSQSLSFITWSEDLPDRLPKRLSVCEQLDRASTSVPLNIAEGNGKFTSPDRCRFFDNARGSALECAPCLDVLVAKRKLSAEEVLHGKEILIEVVSMLVGLIKSNSPDRLYDEACNYAVGGEQDKG